MTSARTICLLAAAAVIVLLAISLQLSRPAAAQTTVTQPIVCTMANSGTAVTVTLVGASNASSIICDGVPESVNANPNTTLTATEPPNSPPSGYVFSGDQSSTSLTACSTGTCSLWDITNYYQWEVVVYYSVSGGGSPTPPSFSCTSGGLPGVAFLTTSPGTVWVDNDCSWTITPNPLAASSGERWFSPSQLSGVVTGAQTIDPLFFNQFDLTMSYSVVGGGLPVAPSLSATQLGSSVSLTLTTSPQDYWLDAGSSWSVSNPAPGSTSAERWVTPVATSGNVFTSSTLSFAYFYQYNVQFGYSVTGGGTGYSPPLLTYSSLGANVVATLTTTGNGYWVDVGSSWSASGQLSGGSASERWSAMVTRGTANSLAPVTVSYYHQYLVTASYSVAGGGTGYTAPSLAYQSYGSSSSAALSVSPTSDWVDAGGPWSVANPLSGSSLAERWETNAGTAGTVLSPSTLSFTYFHQFYVTFGYGVLGGGTGYSPPSVRISQFGTQVSALGGWADGGSRYSYTNPLNGSSSTERWYTGSSEGLIQSSSSINATYRHQYDFVLSYVVVGTTTQPSPPTLNSTTLGLPLSEQLQTAHTDYWLDSGSNWVVSTLLPGSGKNERWMTDQTTKGTVRASSTTAFAYFDQYAAGFSYSIKGGGSPQPPSLNYTAFSAPAAAALSTTQVVYWLDYHSTWSLTNPLPGQSHFERWIAAQGTSGTAVQAFNETATYVHQYYVQVETNAKAGGFAEASSDWYDTGSSLQLNATASPSWRFSGWSGAGEGSYSGTALIESVTINSDINETAVFYAGLTLTSGTGGSVQYMYGQVNGSVQGGSSTTLYVSPGTSVSLTPVPATVAFNFRSWLGNLTGAAQSSSLTVTAPARVSATFGLDYTDIGVFYVVAIAITVLTVFVFIVKRRHAIFGSGQLISSVS